MNKYAEKAKQKFSNIIDSCGVYAFTFYTLMIVAIAISIFLGYVTRGKSLQNMLFFNTNDTFMDFFNSIQYGRDPYSEGVIYPPLMNVIYAFLGHFIPAEMIISNDMFAVRTYQTGLIIYYILTFISIYIFSVVVKKNYCKNSLESDLFFVLMIFSLPFLFAVERGNSIILCFDFLLIYCFGYNSENKIIKHIALISLAIATAMKIYVVFFGVLLLREKKYKDAVICCIYGIIAFFAPFLLLAGESRSIKALIENILFTSGYFSEGHYGYKQSIASILDLLTRITNLDFSVLNLTIVLLLILVIVLSLINPNIEKWKQLAFFCFGMICIPSFSYTYTLILMIIPLIEFLKYCKETPTKSKINIIYLLCFIMMFMPFSIEDNGTLSLFKTGYSLLNWTTVIEYIALYVMLAVLSIESVVSIMKQSTTIKKILILVPFVVVFAVLCVQLFNLKEYSSTTSNENTVSENIVTENNNGILLSKQLYEQICEQVDTDDEIFFFPNVPDTKNFDESEINSLKWSDASDYEGLLDDPEEIFNILPKTILVAVGTYGEEYEDLSNELTSLGYMNDYNNIGIYSDGDSSTFDLWTLNSNKKSTLFKKGLGTSDKPYMIKTADELIEFSNKVNSGWNFAEKYISLANDIDLKNKLWTPIGNYDKGYAFSGFFNGNGYKILNLEINKSQRLKYAALFEYMNGFIYNLDLIDGNIHGDISSTFAAVSAPSTGLIVNCYTNSMVSGNYCGMLAGRFGGNIDCCYFDGIIDYRESFAVAFDNGNLKINNCYFNEKSLNIDNIERIGLVPANNFIISDDYVSSKEFEFEINEKLRNSSLSDLKLFTFAYDTEKDILEHTDNWSYPICGDKLFVTGEAEYDSDNYERIYGFLVGPEGIQYGPYINIECGTYKVTYEGQGFNGTNCDTYSKANDKNYSIKMLDRSNNKIVYSLSLDSSVEDIEFRMFNESDEPIIIDRIILEHCGT